MNTIEFEVHNQTLVRVDSKEIINNNKHIYNAEFTFEDGSEWIDLNKFIIFTDGWGNTTTQHIGKNSNVLSCLIPDCVLSGSYFKVSVYAGDLITTNNVTISLIQSGYPNKPHVPTNNCDTGYIGRDMFVEIFNQLDLTVDSIVYDNKTLYLFNRDNMLESVYLPFLTEEEIIELVSNLTLDFIPLASDTDNGLMSSDDKVKLDSVEENANYTVIDDELNSDSGNAVSNRIITNKFTEHSNRMDGFDNSLDIIREDLNGKEDNYDYVERLDNLIVSLINQGE